MFKRAVKLCLSHYLTALFYLDINKILGRKIMANTGKALLALVIFFLLSSDAQSLKTFYISKAAGAVLLFVSTAFYFFYRGENE
jgi:hypothetical protein